MSITPYSYGNIPTYRFYISEAGSTTYEVFPLNFLSSSLVDEPEKDNVFYRRKFNGSLLFGTNSLVIDDSGVKQNRKDDWLLLWGIEQVDPCAKLFFTITKTVTGVTTTYWEGYFSTTAGKFDINRCTFEVTPTLNDDYVDLLSEANTQYNILDVSPTVTTTRIVYGTPDVIYDRNRWLIDVIEYLADKVVTGVSVSSDFFTNATNPATLNPNKLLYLTIAQKSDIVTPTSSNAARSAMMSWNELMNILWTMFQVRWDYNAITNTINVEHISFSGFAPGMGIDLRTQLAAKALEKYSYLKEKMPKYEKFSFMEADNIDFVGVQIWYNSQCVDQNPDSNVKETSVNVTTDIENIINDPSRIADEGFVILCNYESAGLYYVELEAGALTSNVLPNMHLSWANLQNRYFRHNRILISGYMNGTLTTFWTAQKTKVQECSAIVCDEFDPSEEITTELGETYFSGVKATVDKAELRPTGEIKLTLLYGPSDNENTGIADPEKQVVIYQDGAALYATLTEVSGVDIDIVIENQLCDGSASADIAWHIPAGTIYSTKNIVHKQIIGITMTTAGWDFDFKYDLGYICIPV